MSTINIWKKYKGVYDTNKLWWRNFEVPTLFQLLKSFTWEEVEILIYHTWEEVEILIQHTWEEVEILIYHTWEKIEILIQHTWEEVEILLQHTWEEVEMLIQHTRKLRYWYTIQAETLIHHTITIYNNITKTRLFKYTEHFITKKWRFSDKKFWYFFIFLLKT